MEMKSKKYISVFLLLTFSMLLLHNLFAHHHHSHEHTGTINALCIDKHHDCKDHESRQEDCHYCNEITDYKINSYNYQLKIKTYIVLVIHSVKAFSDLSGDCESYWYTATKIPPIPLEYYGPISMRAPPVNI